MKLTNLFPVAAAVLASGISTGGILSADAPLPPQNTSPVLATGLSNGGISDVKAPPSTPNENATRPTVMGDSLAAMRNMLNESGWGLRTETNADGSTALTILVNPYTRESVNGSWLGRKLVDNLVTSLCYRDNGSVTIENPVGAALAMQFRMFSSLFSAETLTEMTSEDAVRKSMAEAGESYIKTVTFACALGV